VTARGRLILWFVGAIGTFLVVWLIVLASSCTVGQL
jgi:hypothetical protein